jgi:hypothetical protein
LLFSDNRIENVERNEIRPRDGEEDDANIR